MSTNTDTITTLKDQIKAHEHQLAMNPNDRQAQLRLADLESTLTREEDRAERTRRYLDRAEAERAEQEQRTAAWKAERQKARDAADEKIAADATAKLEAEARAAYEGGTPITDQAWAMVKHEAVKAFRLQRMGSGDALVAQQHANVRKWL